MKVWLQCSAQNGCHEAARCPAHEGSEECPAARDGGHLPALLNGAVKGTHGLLGGEHPEEALGVGQQGGGHKAGAEVGDGDGRQTEG